MSQDLACSYTSALSLDDDFDIPPKSSATCMITEYVTAIIRAGKKSIDIQYALKELDTWLTARDSGA